MDIGEGTIRAGIYSVPYQATFSPRLSLSLSSSSPPPTPILVPARCLVPRIIVQDLDLDVSECSQEEVLDDTPEQQGQHQGEVAQHHDAELGGHQEDHLRRREVGERSVRGRRGIEV